MKKQDYIAKRDFLRNEIVRIKNEINHLNSEYMKSNLPLKIGQKVKITIPSIGRPDKVEFGFIRSYQVDYFDNPVYKYNQMKKNGDESRRELFVYGENAIVEPV